MSTSLIFVDSRLSLSADVLKNLPTNSRIITLNSTTDGLQQMADAVSAYQNLDSIHVISHGSAGALYVGNSVLNAQTLPTYSSALSALGNSLSSTGDILLYGCNVAEGEIGAAFIKQLSQATGADVAASTNLTGQGGDWALEAQTGSLETAALNAEGWQGQLAAERDFTVLTQGTGIVTTDVVSGAYDYGRSLAVQADGKILLGGSGGGDFALARYNPDGTLDTSFSGDGLLTTNLGGNEEGYSVAIQADGKILLGGTSSDKFAIARYNTDGSLDTSFSGDGMLITTGANYSKSIIVRADGKILLAGGSYIARYNPDGSLDTSFSGDGMDYTGLEAYSLTQQADGKILLGGYSYESSTGGRDFAVMRYNADGSVDASFGVYGRATADVGSNYDYGQSLTVQADGKILLGGYNYNGDFALVRYNTDGSVDTSFSGDGQITTDLGGTDFGQSLTVQADGKILLGGYNYNSDFVLVRYNTDGSLDTSFSGDGIVTTSGGGGRSLTVQADGKILLGGYSGNDFAIVRYNPDGSLDTSFSRNHTPTGSLAISGTPTQGQTLTVNNAVVDSDGLGQFSYQWLADGVAIQKATGSSFTLTQAQVGKAISVKASYRDGAGTTETLLSSATAAVENANLRPTGSVTVSGVVTQGETLTASYVLSDEDGLGTVGYQWLADGVAIEGATAKTLTLGQAQVGKAISVTASYTDTEGAAEQVTSAATALTAQRDFTVLTQGPGIVTTDVVNGSSDYGRSLAVQADGKILLGGTSGTNFALARYNTDGTLDTSFSGDGLLTTNLGGSEEGYSVAIQADGKILLGGTSDYKFAIARYNTDGSLDTSFSGDGMLTTTGTSTGRSIAVQADGKILLAGGSYIARYNPDGSLDTSFGTGLEAYSLTQQADGKILLGGYGYNSATGGYDFAVMRYNGDGSVDASFGVYGRATADVGSNYDYGKSLTVQADGKILLGGHYVNSDTGGYDFALVRYNTDGSLDTSFSGDGQLTTDLGSDYDYGCSLTVQADGKILLGGHSNGNFAVVRYNADGSLDTSFSGDGQLTTDLGSYSDYGNSLTVQADGKVLLGGYSYRYNSSTYSYENDFAVVRYNPDGSLDTSFSRNYTPTGSLAISGTPTQGQTLTVNNAVVDGDGLGQFSYQWLADGVVVAGGTDFTLTQAQVGKAISVKASYLDGAGTTETLLSSATATVENANLRPTGSVGVAGAIIQGQTLTATHTLRDEDGLGTVGYQWLADGVAIEGATAKTLTLGQAQVGKAISVTASYTDTEGTAEQVTSAATALTAQRDFTVLTQGPGIVKTDVVNGSSDSGRSLAVQADGKILLGGTSGGNFALARYNTDGTLDTGFSGDGLLTTNLGGSEEGYSVAIQADGKILLGGTSDYKFAIARYNTDGSLDTSFSGDGMLITTGANYSKSIIVQADGKILLAGSSYIARYNPDGSLDTSFSGDGMDYTGLEAYSLTQQADGKILLGGSGYNSATGGYDFAVMRYNADGSVDTSFSDDGRLTTDLGSNSDAGQSLTVQADGKILLGGYNYNGDFALVRYNTDGSVDTSFSGDGKLTTDLGHYYDYGYSLTVQADGKILLGGYSGYIDYNFAVVRYNPDGSLDTSFSRNHTPTGSFAISGTPTQGQTLTVNNAVVDGDGLGQFSYQWLADGVVVAGGTDFTLTQAQVGKAISVKASYLDGAGTTETLLSSATAAVENANLRPTGSVMVSGTATQGQTLTLSQNLSDEDGLGTVSYQWLADGVAVQGATGNRFTLTQAQVGKAISVIANYTDTEGTAEQVTSAATRAVINVNDAPTGSVTVTGTAQQNETLTAAHTLADADGLGTVSYQWLADGVAIANATGNTLTLGQAQVGKAISVKASYTDALQTAEGVTSAATARVANVNDVPTGSVNISGTVTQGQNLTVSHTLADVDGLGFVSYQWLADGAAIYGATGATLTLGQAQVGKAISVKASYTDGQRSVETVTSAATADKVANVNDAPTGSVTISGDVAEYQTLTALHTLADADGLGAISYQWLANGVALADATNNTLMLDKNLIGKTISVQASYTDGFNNAETVTSAATSAVRNTNDAPTGTVTMTGTATQGQTLSVSHALADFDGLGTVSYQWLANGEAISGATGSTLTLGQAQVGKAISVKASYIDGYNTAESKTTTASRAVLNVNDAPSGSVTISGTATQGQRLTANHTLADVDGMGTVSYQWWANGVAIDNAINKTFTLGQEQVGKNVTVTASYVDGQGTAESVRSTPTAAVQNINDAPTGGITIGGLVQGQALLGHELRALSTLADLDGLGTLRYQWSADGTPIARATEATFTPTQAQQDKAVSVTVRYIDRLGGAEVVKSAAVLIDLDVQYGDTFRVGVNDRLQGGALASDLYGEAGNDELHGDNGDDRLYGGYGDDALYGEADNDELEGDQGNDKIYGDLGNDKLTGGTGRDSLYGGDGNDLLDGSSDRDFMDGGNGADTYYIDNVGDVVQDSGTDAAGDTVFVSINFPKGYVLGAGIDNATLDALASNSALTGNAGQNELTGNNSDNNLNGDAGNDTLNGGGGKDSLSGGVGSDTLNGGIGEDTLNGGTGDDVYVVDSVGDVVTESANAGNTDTVQASVSYVLSTNVEKLVLSGREVIDGTGNRTDNTLIGNTSKNQISGQAGNDILDAGGGNDTLIGGVGNDILTGGLGKDTFKLDALNESGLTAETRDVINDFRIGEDKIGLAGIDANANKTGDQAFTTFILSSKTFTAAGQLQFKNGVLYGNTDSDADAEFSIALTGITTLGMTDVIA